MATVKRRTTANVVVQHENGEVESIPLSRQNRLLFDHNLWGLLKNGTDILQISGDRDVTIIPNDDSTEFTLEIEGAQPTHISPDLKPRLVDVLIDHYESRSEGEEKDVTPFLNLQRDIVENRVRMAVANYLAEMPPFSEYTDNGILEVTKNGWLFSDELLLTWECEFRHPNTTSRKRNGSVIDPSSADSAYDVDFKRTRERGESYSVEIDGQGYMLTPNELDFMSKALWAAEVPT